jgi:hypothetical protein
LESGSLQRVRSTLKLARSGFANIGEQPPLPSFRLLLRARVRGLLPNEPHVDSSQKKTKKPVNGSKLRPQILKLAFLIFSTLRDPHVESSPFNLDFTFNEVCPLCQV